MAIGKSWRPAYSAHIEAEVEPCKKNIKLDNGQVYKPGAGLVFVRYSSDKKNWSSWQAMQYKRTKDKSQEKYEYTCFVSIPESNRQEYKGYVQKYMKMDVPWKSDEEAVVKWILESDPDFFKKTIPFIGYLQFMYQTSLFGGHRISRIHATAHWGFGGMHSPARDEGVDKNRHVPWRFEDVRSPINMSNCSGVQVEGERRNVKKDSVEDIVKSWGRQKEFFFYGSFKIIEWEEAKEKLLEKNCRGGKQYHTGWLTIYCLDGRRFLTKQPELDIYMKFMEEHELSTKGFGTE